MRRKQPIRALEVGPSPCQFVADEMALANRELAFDVRETFASVPRSHRAKLYWALELALAAPLPERWQILEDLRDRMAPKDRSAAPSDIITRSA
jgi:hypothetical protein